MPISNAKKKPAAGKKPATGKKPVGRAAAGRAGKKPAAKAAPAAKTKAQRIAARKAAAAAAKKPARKPVAKKAPAKKTKAVAVGNGSLYLREIVKTSGEVSVTPAAYNVDGRIIPRPTVKAVIGSTIVHEVLTNLGAVSDCKEIKGTLCYILADGTKVVAFDNSFVFIANPGKSKTKPVEDDEESDDEGDDDEESEDDEDLDVEDDEESEDDDEESEDDDEESEDDDEDFDI